MPQRSTSTVIVGRQTLVRTGISSLVEQYSFRVVATFNSVEDAGEHVFGDRDPELAIVCNQNVERALNEVADIREFWPNTKIVFLFDHLSPDQFQKLGDSSIDGCIPLHVSHELLIRTLNLIVAEGGRILILEDFSGNSAGPKPELDDAPQELPSELPSEPAPLPDDRIASAAVMTIAIDRDDTGGVSSDVGGLADRSSVRLPQVPMLSEREAGILDGLVRGLSNKEIARECLITEATVKVHMKSILRKIQVSNRTQAAIWALGRAGRGEPA